MNYKMVCNTLGKIFYCFSGLLLIPIIVALVYGEYDKIIYFAITVGIFALSGLCLSIKKATSYKIYAREGMVIVALSWVFASLFGALPFYLSGEIPSYIDAFFETVSGFTTAGSSVLSDVEALSYCMLFWRCFTHWIGGMGILTFVLMFVKGKNGNFMHMMRAETSGPVVSKSVARIDVTAKISYIIYFILTALESISLIIARVPVFDSINIAFATAGTGGFTTRNESIAAYGSPAVEIICSIFMVIFSINFGIIFLMATKRAKVAFKNTEFKVFLGIVATAVVLVALQINGIYDNWADSFRHSFFYVSSIISTTGFVTIDYNIWPSTALLVLMLLMIVGGCAGSTAGGVKVYRVTAAIKDFFAKIKRVINPNTVHSIKMNGKMVEQKVMDIIYIYFVSYISIMILSTMAMTLSGYDLMTSFSGVLTTLNNVGPGIGDIVGPKGNFGSINGVCKFILSMDMLIGRLEVFPILLLFVPSTWRRV